MALEASSVIAPVSTGISPPLMLSTMLNARLIATVTITDNAISVKRIKIDPRRYCFKTMCPIPGNIRPDRSAAFIDLVIRYHHAHYRAYIKLSTKPGQVLKADISLILSGSGLQQCSQAVSEIIFAEYSQPRKDTSGKERKLPAKQWQGLGDNRVLLVLRTIVVERARCQVHRS